MSDVGSDEELVRRFRAGERAAFEELYRRYDRRLYGYLLLRTRNEHTAEDLLQDVLAGFLRYVADAEVRAVRPFLFTSARNHAVNWGLRRRERSSALPEVFERGASPATPAEDWLAALPEEQQEVVFLHVWGDLTFAEIAHFVGVPLNTVMSRYRYAMEKLRRDERE